MLNKLDIIDETVEYYKTHDRASRPRSGVNSFCHYYMDGSMCAVGRCLKCPEDAEKGCVNKNILQDLKPEYVGHEIVFWFELQKLHDRDTNWNGKSLTLTGKNYVKELRDKWK